jgi:protein O-GlcNAc transferase
MIDRDQVEVFCYATSADDKSLWRRKVEVDAEHFKDISALMTGDAARAIHADGIHILIDMSGYTYGARTEIFALQPAPLQASLLGFPGTLGAPYIQYLFADRMAVPEFARDGFSESIVYLPTTVVATDHRQSGRDTLDPDKCPSRRSYGLPEDRFVFACFNQAAKVDPAAMDAWVAILKRVPNAVLWLLRFPAAAQENLLAEARARGLDDFPAAAAGGGGGGGGGPRLIFTDVVPREEHLRRCYLADLFLDTPMCSAHTTACDVLWGGTPVLALPAERMSSRLAASALVAAGLPELVTSSLEAYEELAVGLALDVDRLWDVRKRLEDSRLKCALFDTRRWTRNLTAALGAIWERYEQGLPPADIEVAES